MSGNSTGRCVARLRGFHTPSARSGPRWPSALLPLGTDARKPLGPFTCVRRSWTTCSPWVLSISAR